MGGGVLVRHSGILNAYVKVEKEQYLDINLEAPEGMEISEEELGKFGVDTKSKLAFQLKKSLTGLKQSGRL